MSVLKNRCFYITKDSKLYACINVKKDFYVEGIIYESNKLLVGYFHHYNQLNCFLFDNSTEKLNSISFVNSSNEHHILLEGNINNSNYDFYNSEMDEYCFAWLGEKRDSDYSIALIDDLELIEKINYLIRNSIASLNGNNKELYKVIKNHRYGNLKELLKDVSSSYDQEMFIDLKNYLEVLNPNKEEPKKLRKRKKNQNKKVL